MRSHLPRGPCITALTISVTQACPSAIESGGCSARPSVGITHETLGKVPSRAASMKSVFGSTLSSWPVTSTVRNPGSGFCTARVSVASKSSHGATMQLPGPTK